MRLNKEGREQLRIAVDTKINEIYRNRRGPFRIKMPDMDSLEELLFENRVDSDGVKYKVIGFTSYNLKYIDLSEVSFEDVALDGAYYLNSGEMIHLDGTNAKIDLSKTYEYKKHNRIKMSYVDLSNSNLDKYNSNDVFRDAIVCNCDLSRNNLKLGPFDFHFVDCNLSYNDFSNLSLYPDTLFYRFENCNIRNTALNIKITVIVKPESVRKVTSNPMYLGCLINGNKIISEEDKIQKASEIRADYEAWSKVYIDEIVEGLECHSISSHGYDQDKIEKACEASGKIKTNKQYAKKKTSNHNSGLVLTPEQDHDVQNFYGAL